LAAEEFSPESSIYLDARTIVHVGLTATPVPIIVAQPVPLVVSRISIAVGKVILILPAEVSGSLSVIENSY
jgi:hypothetical protein